MQLELCVESLVSNECFEGENMLEIVIKSLQEANDWEDSGALFETTYESCIEHGMKEKIDKSKAAIDMISRDEFCRLRGRYSVYECLGKGPRVYGQSCFINRSAMKMCNMDKAFHLIPALGDRKKRATISKPNLNKLDILGTFRFLKPSSRKLNFIFLDRVVRS